MAEPLSVMLVEDSAADAELILRSLRKAGFEPRSVRVDTEAAFLAHLRDGFDVVLADHSMPHFDSPRALELLRSAGLDTPFIVVSGTIGEEAAVEAMRRGAVDYLMKDRLGRLGSSVRQSIRECALRRERQQALEELKLFRSLMDRSNDTLEIIDPSTGRFIDMNARGPADLGYTREEALKLSVFDVDPSVDPVRWQERMVHLKQAGSMNGEGVHRRKDGSCFDIEYSAAWVSLQRDYVVSVVRDVTVRKQGESALRESEQRFRELAANIHEVFWIANIDRTIIYYVSPAYASIWGRSCESLYERPRSWQEAVHPEDVSRAVAATSRLCALEPYEEEYRVVQPGGVERWVRDRGFPVRGAKGRVERVVGITEDITESKLLNAQFLRAQRMEAIGTLAGGIAHDLNNILSPMLIAPSLLRAAHTDPHDLQLLELIERGAKRGSSIVRQLLTFSRGTAGARVSVQLRHQIREMAEIMRETFPRDIAVEIVAGREVAPVTGDPTQLHQVLMNLCVNARDAMPQGGRLSIRAENVDLGDADLRAQGQTKPGLHVALSVIDTGVGIQPEVIGRIFEPFFTTKPPNKGTGLGLSTVTGIVRSHNGFITVSSVPSRGSTFTVYLPASPTEDGPTNPSSDPFTVRGNGEWILVVDDEAPIRLSLRAVLERHGYRVLTASDGAEALSVFLQHRDSVRVVLTDVMMPVMGGIPLIRALRVASKNLNILAMSGLQDSAQRGELEASGVLTVLQKPCSPEDLLAAVAAQLPSAGK